MYTHSNTRKTQSVYVIYTVSNIAIISYIYIYTFEHTKTIPTQITDAYVQTLDDDRLAAGRSL